MSAPVDSTLPSSICTDTFGWGGGEGSTAYEGMTEVYDYMNCEKKSEFEIWLQTSREVLWMC